MKIQILNVVVLLISLMCYADNGLAQIVGRVWASGFQHHAKHNPAVGNATGDAGTGDGSAGYG